MSFLSSSVIVNELNRQGSFARECLLAEGWEEHVMTTETYSADKTGHEEAIVFTRSISIKEKYPEYFARKSVASVKETSSTNKSTSEKTSDNNNPETGSDLAIAQSEYENRTQNDININSLLDLDSVKAMRSENNSTVIALDTEFFYNGKERFILSYQFTFYDPSDNNTIHECVFFPATSKRLSFWRIISWILTEYNLCKAYDFRSTRRWFATVKNGKRKKFKSPKEAYEASTIAKEKTSFAQQLCTEKPFCSNNDGQDNGYINDYSDFRKIAQDITLICHFGSADLSTFEIPQRSFNKNGKQDILDIIATCTNIQGGLVTLKTLYKYPKVVKQWWKFMPIRYQIRDTMCFAPAGQKSLKSIGASISIDKVELPYEAINHMNEYFVTDPVNYMEYAINDSVICLVYSTELWGINKQMNVTVTSGAAKAAISVIKNYFDTEKVDLHYRGLQKKHIGKKATSFSNNRIGFTEDTCYDPISDDANLIINAATNAYAGGFNGCLGARYVDSLTHDFDLQNAYPTSMSCIIDPAWDNESLILRTIENKTPLTLDDFHSPYDLIFGDIEFEFPKNVLFPCIPVNVNGSLIFPKNYYLA